MNVIVAVRRMRLLRSMTLASVTSLRRRSAILVAAHADGGIFLCRRCVGSRPTARSAGPSFGMRHVEAVARATESFRAALVTQEAVVGPLLFDNTAMASLVEGVAV